MRGRRLLIAATVIWSLVFAQAASAAHACSILASASQQAGVGATAQPMPPGCEGMAKRSNATLNVCESHCFAGHQVYSQADIPIAGIAPHPALTVRVAGVSARRLLGALAFAPLVSAPPPRLRFSRFLI